MLSFEQIRLRSASSDELVVRYDDAMKALDILLEQGVKVLGWEGWLIYSSGRRSHSTKHQGTVDLSMLTVTAAHALVKSTITDAHVAWGEAPDDTEAELYYCISVGT